MRPLNSSLTRSRVSRDSTYKPAFGISAEGLIFWSQDRHTYIYIYGGSPEELMKINSCENGYRDSIQNSYIPKRVADFCCDYGWSVRKMNMWLHNHGMQFKRARKGSWIPTSDLEHCGYVIMKSCESHFGGGYVDLYCKNYWTPKGRLMIHDKLAAEGIFPIVATEKGDVLCESMW